MTPDYKLIADTKNITELIKSRILRLTIKDEAGVQSDSITIELDDRNGEIEWPRHGAELNISLGYVETNIVNMGTFIVDEITHSGPPDTLTINAKATNMRASVKERKTRAWENLSIADIVNSISNEHGYTPSIAQELGSISIGHRDQIDESDLHFLTRLAYDYNAVSKIAGNHWIFAERGKAKAASGVDLPIVEIEKSQVLSHRLTHAERGKYSKVIAHWHDAIAGEKAPVSVGSGKPTWTMRHGFNDKITALNAARSKLEALTRGVQTLSLTVLGNVQLQAEGKINLRQFRAPISSDWTLTRVTHQIDSSGFITMLEADLPV